MTIVLVTVEMDRRDCQLEARLGSARIRLCDCLFAIFGVPQPLVVAFSFLWPHLSVSNEQKDNHITFLLPQNRIIIYCICGFFLFFEEKIT